MRRLSRPAFLTALAFGLAAASPAAPKELHWSAVDVQRAPGLLGRPPRSSSGRRWCSRATGTGESGSSASSPARVSPSRGSPGSGRMARASRSPSGTSRPSISTPGRTPGRFAGGVAFRAIRPSRAPRSSTRSRTRSPESCCRKATPTSSTTISFFPTGRAPIEQLQPRALARAPVAAGAFVSGIPVARPPRARRRRRSPRSRSSGRERANPPASARSPGRRHAQALLGILVAAAVGLFVSFSGARKIPRPVPAGAAGRADRRPVARRESLPARSGGGRSALGREGRLSGGRRGARAPGRREEDRNAGRGKEADASRCSFPSSI